MSLPTLSVRVAFGSNPFDSSLSWTEIGPASGSGPGNEGWVRKIQTKRGRERLLRTQVGFQAGTATVTLDNRDRRFDPTNTAGPYYPSVQPEKIIQVGATWSSTFYPIWTGFVDDWPQNWPGFSEAEVPLVATDLFKAFGLERVLSSGYQKQVIADGAVGFWKFADVAGSTSFLDSATGLLNASPAAGQGDVYTLGNTGLLPGSPDSCIQFQPDANFDLINFPAVPANGSTGATIEFWIEATANNGPSPYVTINLPVFTTSGSSYWFSMTVSLSTSAFISMTDNTNTASGSIPNPTGTVHHVVATAALGVGMNVYVDGALVGTYAGAPATYPNTFPNMSLVGAIGTSINVNMQYLAIYPTALTGTQVLNHYNLAAFRAQYTGQYVQRVLNWLGYPSGRSSVATGYTYCQQDNQSETQTKVLDFLQKLEQTEQGQCYVAADGTFVFEDRYHRYVSPNLTSQATIGDGGSSYPSEIPYAMGGVTLNFDRAELYNDVAVTRRGGNLQEAVNSSSVTEFTNRAAPGLSDLLMNTDQDALYCAQWIVADTAYPQFRVGTLTIDPRVDDRWWPVILGLDIGSVITINKHNAPGTGPAISLACRIEGIEHQINPPREWITTLHVSLVGTLPWLIWDDAANGVWDGGARWGW